MLKCPDCAWYKAWSILGRSGCQHADHVKGVSRDCKDFADKKIYRLVNKRTDV